MMTFVTASIASGNKDTISRTPTFATTIRGDASHTIRKIGKVLRSAARRSFQRGTGFAIRGSNYLVLTWYATPSLYTLTTRRDNTALLRALHLNDEGRKLTKSRRKVDRVVLQPTHRDILKYVHP